MSTSVLATKLFAPSQRQRLVARPRLLAQLDATLDIGQRLTLVSAPPGFGKTTLLSEWSRRLGEQDTPLSAAWVSLDEADNDLVRLLIHVIRALEKAGLHTNSANVDLLGADAGTVDAALTALVNDVVSASEQGPDQRWVLVLDDYHAITEPAVHQAVSFLLEHLPEQLRLVLATRSDPPLPLARLRSRGQLTEVRARDLRFTEPEASEFLNRFMGLDLTAADVRALDERTEGWAAGLQLAALSLRGIAERGDVNEFIDAFAGSNRFVIDYLADEVLARQPDRVRDFLVRTAVLQRLTGSLCDAVTGQTNGAQTLEELERENLFIVPLDAGRSWYRYHHLFADVLRTRLMAEHHDAVPELHGRASSWFDAHGHADDAVRHALAGGDPDRAARLVEQALSEVRRNRQDALLMGWLRDLPDSVVRRSPVLSIFVGWSLMITGDLDAVESRLDDADRLLDAGADDPELTRTWADTYELRIAPATIAVHRASLAQARGDVRGTVHHARRALAMADPADHLVRGAGAGFLGLAAWAAGNVKEALSTFREAVLNLHAAGNKVDAMDSTIVLADMWVTAGRPSRSRHLFEQALDTATRDGEPYPRATADLHTGLAELACERGDSSQAEGRLEAARTLGERGSITENRHRWSIAAARLRAGGGDYDGALRLLDEAAALYRPGFYPDVRPIAAMKARIHISAGDLPAANAWAEDAGVAVDDRPRYLHEYEHLTLARLLLARHGTESAEVSTDASPMLADVLRLLDGLHDAALEAGRHGSLLEIRLLQALAHHAGGDTPRAVTTFGRAVSEAPEPASYGRLFLDEGGAMLTLLRAAAGAGSSDDYGTAARAQARRLFDLVNGAGRAPMLQMLADPLSERELEVLRMLDTELSGPEIARRLYVSVNTLRTHTKRIFTKLDVNSRASAVRRAHERGLL